MFAMSVSSRALKGNAFQLTFSKSQSTRQNLKSTPVSTFIRYVFEKIFGKIIKYLKFGKTYLKRHSSNIRLSFESGSWTFFNDNQPVMTYEDLIGAPLTERASCKVFFELFFGV